MGKPIEIDSRICRKCKYYWGEFCGTIGGRTYVNDSPTGALCSYYVDTGKHRCDDFNPKVKKKPDQDLHRCNKFEIRL